MTVNDTVKYCLLHYPMVFDARIKVLAHMFHGDKECYKWVKGELIYKDDAPVDVSKVKMRYGDIDARIAEHKRHMKIIGKMLQGLNKISGSTTTICDAHLMESKFQKLKRQFIAKNIDVLSQQNSASLGYFYSMEVEQDVRSLHKGCNLFNIPKNATPDWLHGAHGFAQYCISKLTRNDDYLLLRGKNGKEYKNVKDVPTLQGRNDFRLRAKLVDLCNSIDKKIGRPSLVQLN